MLLNGLEANSIEAVVVCVLIVPVSYCMTKYFWKNYTIKQKISEKQKECKGSINKLEEYLEENGIPQKKADEILKLNFLELQDKLQKNVLTAEEVLKAYQAKALEVNKKLNCIVEPVWEALPAAIDCDLRKKKIGPLHGIPVSVKENYYMQGYDSTGGMSLFLNKPAKEDGNLIKVLKHQGAIPFVRTNVPQSMMTFECSNPIYGTTLNPHNLKRGPGGSSGGEGSILGGEGSILGWGTDIGGSVRIPATFSGICSLKPTVGRISSSSKSCEELVYGQTLIEATCGPMARDVDTVVEAMRAVLCQYHFELDPDIPPIPFREEPTQVKSSTVHSHNVDPFHIDAMKVRNEIMTSALENRGQPQQILADKMVHQTVEVRVAVGTTETIKRGIRRQKAGLTPMNPKHLIDIPVPFPDTYRTNLIYDNESADNRILVFATDDGLGLLESATMWFMDGTHSTAPHVFEQVFTVRVPLGETSGTAAYALLPSMEQPVYEECLTGILDACLARNIRPMPTTVVCDYEIAIHNAVRQVLANDIQIQVYSSNKPLRIGYYKYDGTTRCIPGVERGVDEAVAVLEKMGHTMVPFDVPKVDYAFSEIIIRIFFGDGGETFMYQMNEDFVDSSIQSIIMMYKLPVFLRKIVGYLVSLISREKLPSQIVRAMNGISETKDWYKVATSLDEYRKEFLSAWKASKLDALVCPVMPYVAVPSGQVKYLLGGASYTSLYNGLNYPAGVVPVTKVTAVDQKKMADYPAKKGSEKAIKKMYSADTGGLPVGVQCVGLPYQEELVLRVMKDLEQGLKKGQ